MNVRWINGFCLFITLLLREASPLRNVVLTIEPDVVERRHHSTLKCSYELEGDALYCVKWYRGLFEFYRYTPGEHPSTKVFPVGGITVDVNNSNSTQVVLRDIEFNLSGNFSCEVTTDTSFSTAIDTKAMLVVQLPEEGPKISVGRNALDYGDTLRANCSSSPSRPRAALQFVLNNITVARSDPLSPRQAQELSWSDLSLELELYEYHFHQGRLILRCVAQVADIYHEEAELHLDSARDPIPERVRATNSAGLLYLSKEILPLLQFILLVYTTTQTS